MKKIKELEKRLDNAIRRLGQLECDHNIILADKGYGLFMANCRKCKKFFGYATEKEYLEFSLKQNKEQCASGRKELEDRLAKLKEE